MSPGQNSRSLTASDGFGYTPYTLFPVVLLMLAQARACCWILLVMLFLNGCGSKLPKCVPVSGKVTLDGEKVPGPGYIYFTIDSTGTESISRPGTAEFDADGNYKVTSFEPGDGLMPGKYLLRVDCWKTPPNMEGKPVESFIPQKYQDASKSGLELVVESKSKPIKFDINLTSK